jgi:two-component system sensor histidine kinase KdpD
VTQLRAAQQELLRVSQALAAINREAAELRARIRGEAEDREELLTVVSHELRTPVTVITGYNRLLLSGEAGSLSEEQRRFLRESTKSCQRLNSFIGNLLEASRELRGEDALDLKEASLEPSLAGVVSFMRPLLEEHDLRVEIALDPEAQLVRFDAVRIEQVLTNLLGNAIKFARRGSEIRLTSSRIEAAGERFVEISVIDEGPGVSLEDREHIFEPYVRAGEESRAGGLGLGLAICKRIVESHGGAIAVTDRPDSAAGSRFSFTLPAGSPGDAGRKRKES